MLTTTQIQDLNRLMLGLGAPIQKDDVGYNSPDFCRMEDIGMLRVDLTTGEAYEVLRTLQHYKKTQLSDYCEDLEETLAEYEKAEKTVKRRTKADYDQRELILYGVTEDSFILGFREYVECNIREYGRWTRLESGKSAMAITFGNIVRFLKYVSDKGKYGYKASADLLKAIEDHPEEEKKETSQNIILTPTGQKNSYGYDLYELNVNNYGFNQKLWSLKGKGLKYVDSKTDSKKVIISTTDKMLPELLTFLVSEHVDISEVTTKPIIDRNHSECKLIDVTKLDMPFDLYPFQIEDAEVLVSRKKALLGSDMGCVSGDSIVRVKESGKTYTREIKVDRLLEMFESGISFQIKCMVNGCFAMIPIKAVIDKGIRETIRIRTANTYIECTPDHEIYTENGWVEAGKLQVGDTIFENGDEEKCIYCGSTEDLITYPYAKYRGYCKKCMNRLHPNGYSGIKKRIDKDGYVRLTGIGTKHMPNYERMIQQGGIYEHHYVWFINTGHVVQPGEVIHHRDHNKRNNKFNNLQLMTEAEHRKIHADANAEHLPQNCLDYVIRKGKKIYYVPKPSEIISIEPAQSQRVYDIAIDSDTVHNFVCNGIVVHNCGKTIISAVVGLSIPGKKLVICPETLRLNWIREIHFANRNADAQIVYSKDAKNDDIIFGEWTVMGYKTAVKFSDRLAEVGFSCMFVDEAHKAKAVTNYGKPGSQQAETVMMLASKIEHVYLLTGTPMPTRNKDLYNPLVMLGELDPTEKYSFHKFGVEFCDGHKNGYGWDYSGSSNTAELHRMLKKYMVRRLKSEVLPNLKKQRIPILTDAKLSKEYKDIEKRLYCMEDDDTYMGLAMSGRRVLSKCKIATAIEFAEDLVETDESVVIVAEFNETLDALMDHFGDTACCIRGGMNDADKQKAIDEFQSGKKKVCCINLIAAGVGITLTKAHNMVIIDYDWTPANMTQVEDRICRTGQTQPCNIYYICHNDAILDQIFIEMITEKSENIDRVVDDAENTVDLVKMKKSADFFTRLKRRVGKK